MEKLRDIFINSIGLTEDHLKQFLNLVQVRKMRRKETLISCGSVCNFIAFIHTGTLRSFINRGPDERNTDFYFESYFVSAYSSFLTQTPTEHTIEALTDCEILCLSHRQYNDLVTADLAWIKFGKYIADFFLIRKCMREISFLKQTAGERMEGMLKQYPGIEQLIPQYHIASYLGIKPESLSRIKLLENIGDKSALS